MIYLSRVEADADHPFTRIIVFVIPIAFILLFLEQNHVKECLLQHVSPYFPFSLRLIKAESPPVQFIAEAFNCISKCGSQIFIRNSFPPAVLFSRISPFVTYATHFNCPQSATREFFPLIFIQISRLNTGCSSYFVLSSTRKLFSHHLAGIVSFRLKEVFSYSSCATS